MLDRECFFKYFTAPAGSIHQWDISPAV